MVSTGTLIEIVISIFCAIISGVVLRKLQENKKDNDQRHKKNIEAAVKDRELIMAMTAVTELIARKIDGEGINGELHEAVDDLISKRKAVEQFTQVEYFNSRKEF